MLFYLRNVRQSIFENEKIFTKEEQTFRCEVIQMMDGYLNLSLPDCIKIVGEVYGSGPIPNIVLSAIDNYYEPNRFPSETQIKASIAHELGHVIHQHCRKNYYLHKAIDVAKVMQKYSFFLFPWCGWICGLQYACIAVSCSLIVSEAMRCLSYYFLRKNELQADAYAAQVPEFKKAYSIKYKMNVLIEYMNNFHRKKTFFSKILDYIHYYRSADHPTNEQRYRFFST